MSVLLYILATITIPWFIARMIVRDPKPFEDLARARQEFIHQLALSLGLYKVMDVLVGFLQRAKRHP